MTDGRYRWPVSKLVTAAIPSWHPVNTYATLSSHHPSITRTIQVFHPGRERCYGHHRTPVRLQKHHRWSPCFRLSDRPVDQAPVWSGAVSLGSGQRCGSHNATDKPAVAKEDCFQETSDPPVGFSGLLSDAVVPTHWPVFSLHRRRRTDCESPTLYRSDR